MNSLDTRQAIWIERGAALGHMMLALKAFFRNILRHGYGRVPAPLMDL